MEKYIITNDNYIYTMSKDNKPALTVPPGSQLTFNANDCFHGQLKSSEQSIDSLDWDKINPATGPVYIENAVAGDVFKITINEIKFTGNGVMATIPGVGVFGKDIKESTIKILEVSNDVVKFDDKLSFSAIPMIGVIGTAPKDDDIPCGTPDSHGGNMDCKLITEGNILYLPVFVDGGLLAMGDVHARMGDGEVMGTGVEIPADITVTVELLKDKNITDPLLETKNTFYTLASDDTLENASIRAVSNMKDILMKQNNISLETAGMLLSALADLEICQIVDPKLTVRFGLDKKYFK